MNSAIENNEHPAAGTLALLPSVDEVLNAPDVAPLMEDMGRVRVTGIVREKIEALRRRILAVPEEFSNGRRSRSSLVEEVADALRAAGKAERSSGVRRVINATGVVVHTNLGRAPLSRAAVDAIVEAAGYASIEYDVASGRRGPRGPRAVSLLRTLTGAGDALVVNNCAAAALLILSVFARGREVIVSRGELVEIGGDFRIPDVLERSGAKLREVGTTNRTHLRDYQNALTGETAMILKVHPSNYRITGFTKSPSTDELASLARESGVLFCEDAGSGAMVDMTPLGIKGEPVIRDVIAAGADLVSFSGDKLLGGPQSGLIAGRAELIEKLRKDPFFRALRVDKVVTAALEATLESYLKEAEMEEIPVAAMLGRSTEELRARSERFREILESRIGGGARLAVSLNDALSAVGGGASPDSAPATTVVELKHSELSEDKLGSRLRDARVPVIARIEAGRVLLDLRTVSESEESDLLETLVSLA